MELTPEPEVNDKGLERLMQREQALEQREQAFKESEAQLDALRNRLDGYEAAQAEAARDPIGYLKSLNPEIDLKQLAKTAWYHGDPQAPLQHKQQQAMTRQEVEMNRRLAALEEEHKSRAENAKRQEQMDANLRAEAEYFGTLDSYVGAEGNLAGLDLAKAFVSQRPDMAKQSMQTLARGIVQRTGKVPSPEQVAKALNEELAIYQVTAPAAPQQAAPPQPQGTSLRNNSQSINPDRAPVDELSDEFLREQAMAAFRAAQGE
jgi:uncharacterized protein (DUF2267 family)